MLDPSLTYGEILPGQLEHLLLAHKQKTFVDLGSGFGELCKEACLIHKFEHIIGLELHPKRISKSLTLKKQNHQLMTHCQFYLHDLSVSFTLLPTSTVAYLCATCFTAPLLQAMAWWITEHPHIESLITLKPLPLCAEYWRLTKIGMVICTWDNSIFYQYDKKLITSK